jgi:hypothetical protein
LAHHTLGGQLPIGVGVSGSGKTVVVSSLEVRWIQSQRPPMGEYVKRLYNQAPSPKKMHLSSRKWPSHPMPQQRLHEGLPLVIWGCFCRRRLLCFSLVVGLADATAAATTAGSSLHGQANPTRECLVQRALKKPCQPGTYTILTTG